MIKKWAGFMTSFSRGIPWIAAAALSTGALLGGCSSGGTVASSASIPETTATVEPTTTVAPTTTLATASATDLVAALPGVLDLPSGWSSTGGDPDTELSIGMGPGKGTCGGMNADLRAQQNNVVATASSPDFALPGSGFANIILWAFASEGDAQNYMRMTSDQASCPDRVQYTQLEGSGDGQYDGLGDGIGDGEAEWTFIESVSLGRVDAAGADEAFFISTSTENYTNYNGSDLGSKSSLITTDERHGSIVLRAALSGRCCTYGYSNVEVQTDYTPKLEELVAALDTIRPHVLEQLRSRHLI